MRSSHTDRARWLLGSLVFENVVYCQCTENTSMSSGENLLFLFDFTWRSAHSAVCVCACVVHSVREKLTGSLGHGYDFTFTIYICIAARFFVSCMCDDELRAVSTAISPVLVRFQVCSIVYGDFVTTTTHQKTTKQQQRLRQRLMGPVCCCLLLAVTHLLTLC